MMLGDDHAEATTSAVSIGAKSAIGEISVC